MLEEFRPVLNGYLEVSNLGRVRNPRSGHILKPVTTKKGYQNISTWIDKRVSYTRIHRLVAEAFFGPRLPGFEINHKDGNKANNSLKNLEYCTRSHNQRHSYKIGLKDKKGEKHHFAILSEATVREVRVFIADGYSNKEIAEHFGVHPSTISSIKNGKSWSHVV